jgi:AraC-like DNA-binding protein
VNEACVDFTRKGSTNSGAFHIVRRLSSEVVMQLGWRRVADLPGVELVEAKFQRELPQPMVLDAFLVGLYVDGVADIWTPGGSELLTAGALAVSSPGHVARTVRRRSPEAHLRSLLIAPSAVAAAIGRDAASLSTRPTRVVSDGDFVARTRRMLAAIDDDADALALQSAFVELAAELAGTAELPVAPIVDRSLKRVRDYLHGELGRNVSLDELSIVADQSKFHLVRRFTAAYGVPPHRYHLYLRLERARALLATDREISEIAVDLGFADQSHLTRRFSRAFRVSPARYRARMRAR